MARVNKRTARYQILNGVLASLVMAMVSLIPTGASAQGKAAKKSVDSLGSVIEEATWIREQVQGAIGSLDAMTSNDQAKLRKHFNAYSKNVERLTKAEKTIGHRVEDMQARRENYRQEWEKEMEAVSSPEIRAHMRQRQQEVRMTLERIQPPLREARETFPPFLTNLQDIERMLSVDLSRSGVEAATPIARRAMDEGNTIMGALDTMITVLSDVKAQVSASGK